MERAFIRDVRRADTLCALAAVVDREHQGAGVSARVNETMKQFAVRRGLRRIIAPARPTWKSRHPLTPIERYWEEWAGMDYPESGSYVVPDALDLLRVDVVTDRAVYAEPNIWVLHPLDSTCAVPIRQE
ncbi:MAG TPA: hypothetical protein VF221_18880 [Chloroflexota bacterium]